MVLGGSGWFWVVLDGSGWFRCLALPVKIGAKLLVVPLQK